MPPRQPCRCTSRFDFTRRILLVFPLAVNILLPMFDPFPAPANEARWSAVFFSLMETPSIQVIMMDPSFSALFFALSNVGLLSSA